MTRSTSTAILLTILVGGFSGQAFSAVKNLPEEVRASLKDASGFQIRASVSAIPSSVRVSFAKSRGGEPFAMAEPGGAWQATDVILKPGLPHRLLGKVAMSQSFCILFYEPGVRGHGYHAVVFSLSKDHAKLVWRAVLDEAIMDPAALRIAIEEWRVEDDPKYAF